VGVKWAQSSFQHDKCQVEHMHTYSWTWSFSKEGGRGRASLDEGDSGDSYWTVLDYNEEPILVLVISGARLKKRVFRPVGLKKWVDRSVEWNNRVVRPVSIQMRKLLEKFLFSTH
jgi:hypothetical protein